MSWNHLIAVVYTLDPVGLWILLGLLTATFIWSVRTRRQIASIRETSKRAQEFLGLLPRYWESHGDDAEAYGRMVYLSPRIQTDLGPLGVMSYKPPRATYFFQNCQVVLNLVPELQKWMRHETMLSALQPAEGIAQTLHETILRHLGVLDDWEQSFSKKLGNPLALLHEGMRWVLTLPLEIASSLGLIGRYAVRTIRQSSIAGFAAGIVTLISLASGIVTLIVGWKEFISIIRKWLAL